MSLPPVRYLSRDDVAAIGPGMAEIIDALDTMFAEKAAGRVEMPPKPGIHPAPDSFLHAMPAWVPALGAAGLKWVSAYPGNRARGLPYVAGLIVLNDPETGLPTAVIDATWITAKRTGAASAVAAKYLARPESRSLGVLACGVQGRSHLEAFATLFDLERVVCFDVDRDAAGRYAEEMREVAGVPIEIVTSPRAAIEGLDLVVTSGPILEDPDPVIEPGWLAEGSFAVAVDFDSYWQGAALREVDRFVTDDLAQMDYYRELGYFRDIPTPHAGLGAIVAGRAAGRTDASERTLAMPLGLAAADMVTAVLVLERARAHEVGTVLPL
ncbi:MAG: ornithine cyclodeaminase family protein [Longimicrobiales bacterium]|nr:ornithine cyclodeaminase family protein [Longimicrobiales bacterium]